MLTLQHLIDTLAFTPLTTYDPDTPVTGGYAGDLLSWVMSRCAPGDAWITVMGSLNAVAVAVLADAACIILAEDAALDNDAATRAEMQSVPILRSSDSSFVLSAALTKMLQEEA